VAFPKSMAEYRNYLNSGRVIDETPGRMEVRKAVADRLEVERAADGYYVTLDGQPVTVTFPGEGFALSLAFGVAESAAGAAVAVRSRTEDEAIARAIAWLKEQPHHSGDFLP
jgi:hypothetical protein